MSNLLSAYNVNGNVDVELWYTTLFNEIPCKYTLDVQDDNKCLDIGQIRFDKCKHLFNEIITYRETIDETEESSEKEEEIEFSEIMTTDQLISLDENSSMGTALTIISDHKIYVVTYHKCQVLYSPKEDLNEIRKFVTKLWDCFPKEKVQEKLARVGLIKCGNGEYYTSFSDIRKVNVNIEENYNDDFLPVYKDMLDFLNQRESGLILAWGSPGTGKTSLIRHLCSTVAKDYVIVPNSVASRLGDPDFISYITSCKDYVFILEDCEQLLVDREDNPWNNAITTILNMADGLLSDVVNIKFICTFNAAVDKIDKALLRKGRCFAKYEFKELCAEKVEKLNAKYNLGLKEIKPMTLAEIYNSEKTDYSEGEKKPKKIGF